MPISASKKRIMITLKRTTLDKIDREAKRKQMYQAELVSRLVENLFAENPKRQGDDDK